MRKSLALFGATGSVGQAAIDLVRAHPENFRFSVLTAHSNVKAMADLVAEFQPDFVVMADADAASELARQIPRPVLSGAQGLEEAAQAPYDLMISAIVGFAGLAPTYAAVRAGHNIALANKEALVCAGGFIQAAAQQSGSLILPVDSEHNAIFQCWEDRHKAQIKSIQLTGSGGPFRSWSRQQIAKARLDQALKHPNWPMGAKITIDSATLMNKALEMIEAHWLFGLPSEQIEVVIHPQSIVHSCVTYADGSVLAQLASPDMRTPLAYCLAYPDRAPEGGTPLRLMELGALTFEAPDEAAFPALSLARAAVAQASGAASIALNAANEILNLAVREARLPFGRLVPVLQDFLGGLSLPAIPDMAAVATFDEEVRIKVGERIA